MQELVELVENEARVSHLVVAQSTEVKVESIQTLITKNYENFEEFGTLRFKIGRVNNGNGLQPKTYYLNEPQATFLMTLLRNKPIVIEFKKKLVKAFYELKEEKPKQDQDISKNDLMLIFSRMIDNQTTMIENQSRQTEALVEILKSKESAPQIAQTLYIDSRSRKKMRDAINARAKEISQDLGVSKDTIAPAIWIELKRFFDVDDYQDIHQSQVSSVMNWIMMYESVKPRPILGEIRV